MTREEISSWLQDAIDCREMAGGQVTILFNDQGRYRWGVFQNMTQYGLDVEVSGDLPSTIGQTLVRPIQLEQIALIEWEPSS